MSKVVHVEIGDEITIPHYSELFGSRDETLDRGMAVIIFIVMGVRPMPIAGLEGHADLLLRDSGSDADIPWFVSNTQIVKVNS